MTTKILIHRLDMLIQLSPYQRLVDTKASEIATEIFKETFPNKNVCDYINGNSFINLPSIKTLDVFISDVYSDTKSKVFKDRLRSDIYYFACRLVQKMRADAKIFNIDNPYAEDLINSSVMKHVTFRTFTLVPRWLRIKRYVKRLR